ncbi:MAG TPA: molybdenum cofactor synthesis domain-containing protein [Kofleriaceae bacterium]|nr:molybdenum cofactor synthesis domain-containing protein [Kofleriaceae bacterium]
MSKPSSNTPFVPVHCAVVTVTDTRTEETDTSGKLVVELLTGAGHRVDERELVVDEKRAIQDVLARVLGRSQLDIVVMTGGTGLTPRDVTPEAVAPFVTKPIPGFGELFRWLSYAEIGTSTIQSRAEAMLCGQTLVFLLPGSPAAVRTALEKVLLPQLDSRTGPCNFVQLLPRIRGEAP